LSNLRPATHSGSKKTKIPFYLVIKITWTVHAWTCSFYTNYDIHMVSGKYFFYSSSAKIYIHWYSLSLSDASIVKRLT